MSVAISGKYVGNKRLELTHVPSGAQITTDAPKDNQGLGTTFSPTDLVASGLAACMLTTIAIVADRDGINIDDSSFHTEKHMSDNPRRIGKLPVVISLPAHLTEEQRAKLERVAMKCPVHHSLHPDIEVQVSFRYI